MLPGGRRDGDDDTAGDRDREEQLAVPRVPHGTPQSQEADGGGHGQEDHDLKGAFESEPQERAVQGLVGQAVRPVAEPGARDVVQPVRPGVVRHRGPGQRGAAGEGGCGGRRGPAAAGEPEEDGEEQDGGLESGGEADQHAGGAFAPGHEPAEEEQQDGQDACLAEVQRVADGQRHHEQGDGDGGREEHRAAAHRNRQGTCRDDAECGDEQQGPEGPHDAERLFGRGRQRFEDEPREG
ncbi:hypothetical protein Sfulv_16160 [Streptomyces fulvorobeus]|uniref:Uncharacterized protein n=1 Tax=Streptomyces fulvorobeus TaxID=284028 RepID=A0A7J0C2R4_9ACTN|nr:hypothetical protein Sfulv_16160 [Streptomyces fulvorobeus]